MRQILQAEILGRSELLGAAMKQILQAEILGRSELLGVAMQQISQVEIPLGDQIQNMLAWCFKVI